MKASWEDDFNRLFTANAQYIYRFALRLSRNTEEAEDLVQELALNLYSRREDLTTKTYLRTWLGKCTYHLFLSRRKSAEVRLRVVTRPTLESGQEIDPIEQIPSDDLTPEELAESSSEAMRIQQALRQLSAAHAQILKLHDMDGLTLPSLSKSMEIPLGTLKSRLHRARAALRSILSEHEAVLAQ
ncbi:MAG: RNA polymerase sigma factor [Gammaproteobacteria bacterium]